MTRLTRVHRMRYSPQHETTTSSEEDRSEKDGGQEDGGHEEARCVKADVSREGRPEGARREAPAPGPGDRGDDQPPPGGDLHAEADRRDRLAGVQVPSVETPVIAPRSSSSR